MSIYIWASLNQRIKVRDNDDDEHLDLPSPYLRLSRMLKLLNAAVTFFPFLQMSLKARSVRPSTSISFFADSAHFVTQKLNHTESFSFLRLVYILAQWDFNIWSNITRPRMNHPRKIEKLILCWPGRVVQYWGSRWLMKEKYAQHELCTNSTRALHELYRSSTPGSWSWCRLINCSVKKKGWLCTLKSRGIKFTIAL